MAEKRQQASAKKARVKPVKPSEGGLSTSANTRRFQAKRQVILQAAALRFNAQGLKGATLADIAGDVGLVTTSVTYYYRRKEDLAVACYEQSIATHRALAEQAARAASGVAQRVSDFLLAEAELPAAQEQGMAAALIEFSDIRALPEAQAAEVFAAYNQLFKSVRALLQGLETSEWHRDDLNARAHLLLSVAHSLRAWLARYELDDHRRVARQVVNLLLNGIASEAQSWPAPQQLPGLTGGAEDSDMALEAMNEAFLRAATELVNEQGYRGASVDRISARLQLTKGAFYHHNDTKLDLVSACFERSHALVRRTLQAAEQAHGLGWHRACAAAAALVHAQLSSRGPLLRATALLALPMGPSRDRVRLQSQRLNERIVGMLVDGLVDGSVRPLDPSLAAQMLASATNAAAELRRWVPGVEAERAVAVYARPALCGLLCAPGVGAGKGPAP